MARKISVEIVGDASKLERTYRSASNETSRFGKSFGGLKVGALAAVGGLTTVAFAAKGFIDKATESQVVQKQMIAQLEASGLAYEDYAKQIDTVITKQSMLAGQDDEELTSAFTNVVRVTGDVNKGLRGMAIASDLAAARGMDLGKAGELVGKVYAGKISSLSRYGIVLGKNATVTEALTALEQKFGGQAEASATAQNKLGVVWENLQEKLGAKLLPLFERFANWLIANMPQIEATVTQTFQKLGEATEKAWQTIQPFIDVISDSLPVVMPLLQTFGEMAMATFQNMITPMEVIVKLLQGDWGGAWDAAKAPVERLMKVLGSIKTTVIDPLMARFTDLTDHVMEKIDGIVSFFTALPGRIAATFANLAGTALQPFKDAFTATRNWIDQKVDDIFGFFRALPGRIGDTVSSLVKAGLQPFESAFTTTSNAVKKVLGFVYDGLEDIKRGTKWIGEQGASLFKAFERALGPIVDGLMALLRPLAALINGIVASVKWLIENIPNIPSIPNPLGGVGPTWPPPGTPGLAAGGIVRRPTFAMIGEAGPEAVIPLNRAGSVGGQTINVYAAGSILTEGQLIDKIHQGLIRRGRTAGELFTRTQGVRV